MRLFDTKEHIRRLAVLGAFLLVIAGCTSHRDRRHLAGPPTTPKDWTILVGPHPCTLSDDENLQEPARTQVVSKRDMNKITWKTGKQRLQLVFHLDPSCPDPFGGLINLGFSDPQRKKLYALKDDGSGNIVAKVLNTACECKLAPADCEKPNEDGQGKWQIKYDQYIVIKDVKEEVVVSCDGMIIIRP